MDRPDQGIAGFRADAGDLALWRENLEIDAFLASTVAFGSIPRQTGDA